MAERDGTIVIDTQIDTKGVDAGSEKTEASLRRMAQKVNDIGATAKAALNKQIDAFARLNSQYDSQSEKIDALKRKIAGYSDEYGEMQAKIDETVKKLNDLEMMQGVIKDAVKDSAKRGTTFDTTQYKWVQEDIEKLTKEIEVAEREQDNLDWSALSKAASTLVLNFLDTLIEFIHNIDWSKIVTNIQDAMVYGFVKRMYLEEQKEREKKHE